MTNPSHPAKAHELISSKRLIISFFILFCMRSYSYIPPLPYILKQVMGERDKEAYLVFRHHLPLLSLEVEERGVRLGGKYLFCLKGNGSFCVIKNKSNYQLKSGQGFASRSDLFNTYFYSLSSDEFTQVLLREGFLKREHLLSFRPEFKPEGDPKKWPIKENYLSHDDIFYSILPMGLLIQLKGNNRALFFDPNFAGIKRADWGTENARWEFQGFSKQRRNLPRTANLVVDEKIVLTTELLEILPAREKLVNDLKTTYERETSPTSEQFTAMQTILGYR